MDHIGLVEIAGNVPAHWEVLRVRNAVDMRVSNVDKHTKRGELPIRLCNYVDVYKNDKITKQISFMRATASAEEIERFRLEKGDILLTKDSEAWNDIGVPALVEDDAKDLVSGYHLALLRPRKDMLSGAYLLRAFQCSTIAHQFHVSANGVTRYGLSHSAIKLVLLPLPPLPEQHRIAAFLDRKTAKIDEAINKKQRLIELLKEQKAILINQAVTKGLNPNVPMRDSGVEWIGEVPAHWGVKRVKHLFRLVVEPAPTNNDMELLSIYTDIGVRPRRELEERGNRATTTDGYWKVKKGDFIVNKLLAWMGAIGLSSYEGVTSPAYDILRPQKEVVGEYFHYLFRTSQCSSELKKHSRGIMEMRLRLYFDKFGMVFVPFPPTEEQAAIAAMINLKELEFEDAVEKIQKEISLLQEYRTILIANGVTGKLDVREVAGEPED